MYRRMNQRNIPELALEPRDCYVDEPIDVSTIEVTREDLVEYVTSNWNKMRCEINPADFTAEFWDWAEREWIEFVGDDTAWNELKYEISYTDFTQEFWADLEELVGDDIRAEKMEGLY